MSSTTTRMQKFPVTRGSSVYVTDPTNTSAEANSVPLNTALSHLKSNGNALTDAQASWLNKQLASELQTEADAEFSVTTSVKSGKLSYWADQTDEADMVATIQVLVKFENELVDADSTPDGWTKTATGTYEKAITKASGASATTFRYSIQSGDYAGLQVKGDSTAKSISVSYPAWRGFYGSNDATDVNTAIASLTRLTAGVNNSGVSLGNGLSTDGYYWIVTHGSAIGKASVNFLNDKVDSSITVNGRTLSGYHIYISTNSASAGASFDNVDIVITL